MEVQGARVIISKKNPLAAAGQWTRRKLHWNRTSKSQTLGIEGQYLTVAGRRSLSDELPRHIRVREAPPLVERARMGKDAGAIRAIRTAVDRGAELFNHALQTL